MSLDSDLEKLELALGYKEKGKFSMPKPQSHGLFSFFARLSSRQTEQKMIPKGGRLWG